MTAFIGRYLLTVFVIDLGSRDGMDIVAVTESLKHYLVAREIGHQSQLYLRIVGRQEKITFVGYEGTAYLASLILPYRDILQVWCR